MALSERLKIQQLLNTETLGNHKPSQLLWHMYLLAGYTNDNIVKHIFLQRMPQPILATVDKDATLDKITEVADQIMEHTSVHTTIASSTTIQENNELKKKVALLTQQMEAMNKHLNTLTTCHRHGRSFNKNRYSKFRSCSNSPSFYCWYHNCFQENARKFIQPCAFKIRSHLN